MNVKTKSSPEGFSLLEVLIAIVVLSIGLLGLAGLQFWGLRGNNQSFERSQAHLLAQEIADVMRANRVAAAAGRFRMAPDDLPDAAGVDCREDACNTTDDAAAFELERWFLRLGQVLPGSTARIQCTGPAGLCADGMQHAVQIMWDEYREGLDIADPDAVACPLSEDFDDKIHLACVRISFIP